VSAPANAYFLVREMPLHALRSAFVLLITYDIVS